MADFDAQGDDPTDDDLWRLLRGASAHDRIPAAVRAAAGTAIAWRDPDSALALLVADSALESEPDPLAGVRAAGGPRLLTFQSEGLTIEVEASGDGRRVRLIGQIAPAGPARISVDHRDGVTGTETDMVGRFTVDGVSAGPVRLRCAGPPPVRTDWVLL